MSYKEYDLIEAEYNGYKGQIYKDNMFGMEFTNFSLLKDGKEIVHATLENGKYTKAQVVELIICNLKSLRKLEVCDD